MPKKWTTPKRVQKLQISLPEKIDNVKNFRKKMPKKWTTPERAQKPSISLPEEKTSSQSSVDAIATNRKTTSEM